MKKEYKKPIIEGVEVSMLYGIMFGASGEINADDAMGKEHNDVVDDDDETSMLDQKSNSLFTNNYIKKVWD